MDIAEIRLKNYRELLRRFRVRPDQIGLPDYGLLKRFSEFANVSSRYLSHVNNGRKNIGNDLARQFESAFELPRGWMDNDHDRVSDALTSEESRFLDVALRLFRESPVDTQQMLMRYMLERKGVKVATPERELRGVTPESH